MSAEPDRISGLGSHVGSLGEEIAAASGKGAMGAAAGQVCGSATSAVLGVLDQVIDTAIRQSSQTLRPVGPKVVTAANDYGHTESANVTDIRRSGGDLAT
ncbi:hypothetical protein GTV32_01725 [Gordonia sp. SID5947]|uniref:hypothetical protein n=1 Tax=Gordonia sp. SID5947 TaxID=2690315 RepID=UPI001370BD48|nr:hypothetical protein [Gordonia sp. SID5947]MYR05129.1 hypothetical protein [Gordonia sp. SID5947]